MKKEKNMSAKTMTGDAKAIVAYLSEHKGQHVPITWRREMKTRKGTTEKVEKLTRAYVRAGIDYANLASVKEGIESGERGEVQPLPAWQEWAQFPFILRHKENGTEYVRLYPAKFDNLKPHVEYYVNGALVNEETVKPLCLASEFRERETPAEVFQVKADSILSIG
jgi:hypothetical protein